MPLHGPREAPLILVVFHSGCPWCKAEMPKLSEAFSRHRSLDVDIMGVAVGSDTAEIAGAFAAERGLRFPIAVDATGAFRAAYPVSRVPSVIAIDRDGTILRVFEGWAEQLPGIVEHTVMSLARGDELPDYALIGNGCAVG